MVVTAMPAVGHAGAGAWWSCSMGRGCMARPTPVARVGAVRPALSEGTLAPGPSRPTSSVCQQPARHVRRRSLVHRHSLLPWGAGPCSPAVAVAVELTRVGRYAPPAEFLVFSDSATAVVEPAVRAQLDYATRTVTRLSESIQGLRDTETVLLEKREEVGSCARHTQLWLRQRRWVAPHAPTPPWWLVLLTCGLSPWCADHE